ncbi:YvrJ family protein [Bacillus cereus group sp. N24]|uniref:YvrJ family protein n=1 Tax=Bacillus cereus group sp. N24 TaxID=2794592 RepID=UPI0018F7BA74|nr:YvrJ family protein [Bacillus cereus group sp. N24]MBJ7950111.1 YvrJ family protein [Bacillus cereus group sp. N24]
MDPLSSVPMWVSLIGNYGFPIALTIYLLIRFEKKLEKLTDSIIELKEVFQKK